MSFVPSIAYPLDKLLPLIPGMLQPKSTRNPAKAMIEHDLHFPTNDGLRLYTRCWLPDDKPQATVALIHGITEHGGRYRHVGKALSEQGYGVYALDLRGHGLSSGSPIYTPSFDMYLDDVMVFLRYLRGRQPGQPLFLFGHSMGGLIVAWLAVRRDPDVCGLIFSAAAFCVSNQVAPWLQLLAVPASWLLPRMRVVKVRAPALSRDPQAVAQFNSDPLVYHGRMPNRTGAEILRAARRIQGRFESIRLPFLALHGTADVITDPEGSRQVYQRAASTDKTLKLYQGLYHDLFHEPERDRIVADLLDWLGARSAGCH
jgi:alpha-beta hydrolase superfamily lysophospholipase